MIDGSDTQSPRLLEKEWLKAKRTIQNSVNPPASKEVWDEAMHFVQDVKAHTHAQGQAL